MCIRDRAITLCPNYFLAESALRLSTQNLYTAHELTQMVPLFGLPVYQAMRRLNTWTDRFLPNAQVGHCVHHIAAHPSQPDRLFMQKHWDVMRSDDAGDNWHEVSGNLPSDFGFVIDVHAHEPETVSYTHLDVYKRQRARRYAPRWPCRAKCA